MRYCKDEQAPVYFICEKCGKREIIGINEKGDFELDGKKLCDDCYEEEEE